MNLIGISGKKLSGKDTVAGMIANYLIPLKTVRIGFADTLKDELCAMLNITSTYLDEHKDNFRLIMQGYGTDFRRKLTSDDYWILKLEKKITELPSNIHTVVIPDVRFLNEAEYIKKLGGKLIRVERGNKDKPWLPIKDSHVSEQELTCFNYYWDAKIVNNYTLKELQFDVENIRFLNNRQHNDNK